MKKTILTLTLAAVLTLTACVSVPAPAPAPAPAVPVQTQPVRDEDAFVAAVSPGITFPITTVEQRQELIEIGDNTCEAFTGGLDHDQAVLILTVAQQEADPDGLAFTPEFPELVVTAAENHLCGA